ncbi:MAG: hypothetical protein JSV84_02850 [Gemmatimonadota bacterium]|nr:MAG: hypothetical protein JSV84_02850 [Gemmatimonadota bacterium]
MRQVHSAVPVLLVVAVLIFASSCAVRYVANLHEHQDILIMTGDYPGNFESKGKIVYVTKSYFLFHFFGIGLETQLGPKLTQTMKEELAAMAKEQGGDAVVNLQYSVSVYPILPIIWGGATATVTGEVIKRLD